MALKWDHSFTRTNRLTGQRERIREMYFQDHISSSELIDVEGRFMHYGDISGRPVSTAKRNGRQWVCTRQDSDGKKFYFAANKELAVDFMLGRPVPHVQADGSVTTL